MFSKQNSFSWQSLKKSITSLFNGIKLSSCLIAFFASGILAFGLYNIHSFSGVTEGGVLGLTLLLEHWFRVSPAVSGFILNLACYVLGWKTLGRHFVIYSTAATFGFSISYTFFEYLGPVFPKISEMPFTAAIVGAIFVGVSIGLCVRVGGAPSGDDALAMSIGKITKLDIQWVYLLSDLCVLILSLSYIPWNRMVYSLITVILSGQIIGWMQKNPSASCSV